MSNKDLVLPNFPAKEFMMGDKNVYDKMNESFLIKLQVLRDRCGFPLVINSSYRTPEYNKSVGGSPGSYHILGRAVDIKCLNSITRARIIKEALNMGLSCGIYKSWIHVDDRDVQLVYVG
jgi:uncharacterized protein YcbK (DUF882 family)